MKIRGRKADWNIFAPHTQSRHKGERSVQGRRKKKALSHAAAEILFSLTDPPPYTADNDGNTKRQRQHAGGPTLHNVWGMYLMNTPCGVHAHGTLGGGASLESGA